MESNNGSSDNKGATILPFDEKAMFCRALRLNQATLQKTQEQFEQIRDIPLADFLKAEIQLISCDLENPDEIKKCLIDLLKSTVGFLKNTHKGISYFTFFNALKKLLKNLSDETAYFPTIPRKINPDDVVLSSLITFIEGLIELDLPAYKLNCLYNRLVYITGTS